MNVDQMRETLFSNPDKPCYLQYSVPREPWIKYEMSKYNALLAFLIRDFNPLCFLASTEKGFSVFVELLPGGSYRILTYPDNPVRVDLSREGYAGFIPVPLLPDWAIPPAPPGPGLPPGSKPHSSYPLYLDCDYSEPFAAFIMSLKEKEVLPGFMIDNLVEKITNAYPEK